MTNNAAKVGFSMTQHSGFTLVELVTTMILIGILAVTALPRFIGPTSYSAYSLRSEFLAELRLVLLDTNSDSFNIDFDINGRPQLNCNANNNCIQTVADESLVIAISAEGYMYEN